MGRTIYNDRNNFILINDDIIRLHFIFFENFLQVTNSDNINFRF